METVASQAVVAGRTVRGRGVALARIGQWRISEDWSEPVPESGAALMETYLREPPDGDDLARCSGCRCEAAEAYFATDQDETDLSLPGDALCEACSYAL
eukprot:7817761-Alexandrium_andersonii.AAC.1